MTCGEYLALHSELLDERLGVEDELRCRDHALSCASCARYDRVLRRGLRLVRELPAITPSSQFLHRFQHRILRAAESNGGDSRFAASGTMLALAIAGVIAVAAWSPLLRPSDPVDRVGRDAEAAADVDAVRDAGRATPASPAPSAPSPIIRAWYDGSRASAAFGLTGARFSPGSWSSFALLASSAPERYSPLGASPTLQRAGKGSSTRAGQ